MNLKEEIYRYALSHKKIDTHCHHMGHVFFEEIGLKDIFGSSYIAWCHKPFQTEPQRRDLFENICDRSYFLWLERALQKIYGIAEPLNADTWDKFDRAVREADRKDRNFSRLRTLCGYEHIVQDCYWNYGDNLGDRQLFTPAFRINIFLNGFDREFVDQDRCCITKYFPEPVRDIEEYVARLRAIVQEKHKAGCVALKCAIAYERGLDFYAADAKDAEIALRTDKASLTKKNREDFQSYIFYRLCDIAAEEDMPFQIHTGLGQVEKTRALCLTKAVKAHPATKFVLFHLSFPYIDDVISLAHNFDNVYPDICWVPLLSFHKAKDTFNSLLDTVNADKLCWGCDTWTVEESYGAVLAMAYTLSEALSQRIGEGFMTLERAKKVCDKILYENAKRIYRL